MARGSGYIGRQKQKFPWLPLVLLLGSIYLFWVWPKQTGKVPIRFEWTSPKK